MDLYTSNASRYIAGKVTNLFNVSIVVALIFLCRYNFKLSFLPFTVFQFVQGIGFVYLLILIALRKFTIPQWQLNFFVVAISLGSFAFLSATRDLHSSMSLVRSILNVVFYYGIVLLIVNRTYKHREFELGRLLDCWIYASVVQMLITILMFLNHDIFELVNSFQSEDMSLGDRAGLISVRMIGLGNAFFGAGFNYSTDLFVMALMPYVKGSSIYENKLQYWLIIAMVSIVGFLSARTFIVGACCVLLFLFIQERKHIVSFMEKSFKVVLIMLIACFVFYHIMLNYISRIDQILDWAFELFINFSSGHGVRSNSTDVMFSMYIFPENLSTWTFGDGKYMASDGHYYMGTDIGFIRLIFFWGLPCTILYYLYQLYFARTAYKKSTIRALRPFLLSYVLFVYLCNLKGYISGDILILFLLIYTTQEYRYLRSLE